MEQARRDREAEEELLGVEQRVQTEAWRNGVPDVRTLVNYRRNGGVKFETLAGALTADH